MVSCLSFVVFGIVADQNVRRNAQFLASAKLDVAQAEVMKFLTEMKAKPQPGKNSNIKGFITDPVKGVPSALWGRSKPPAVTVFGRQILDFRSCLPPPAALGPF